MRNARLGSMSEMDFLRKVCPTATADVEIDGDNECLYRFTLTVTRGCRNISGTYYFKLASGFSDFTIISTTAGSTMAMFDETTGEGTWSFDTTDENPAELVFTLAYTGDAGVDIFDDEDEDNNRVEYTLTWKGCTLSGTIDVDVPDTETAEDCPITPPVEVAECCEATCTNSFIQYDFDTCETDNLAKTVPVTVAPISRRISAHLDFPEVCTTKDVVVGVFLTEVMADGSEVDYAHKVIRRTATAAASGTCLDDRDCNCVDFMIDDDEACSGTRSFRIRTQAHYVEAATTTAPATQQCACNCPND